MALTPRAYWHPFADLAAVEGRDFVLASGHGAHVTDINGRTYFDATAALWYCNVGHGRTELAEAAARQMSTLASYSTFGDNAVIPALDLADRLAALSRLPDARVFLTSGGSDAVDTAVKMVRRHWSLAGQPDRQWIITRERSYHGMHMAGTSLAGIEMNRGGYGDLDPKVVTVVWDDPDALEQEIARLGSAKVAAFFCEPVIGAGGVYPPPEGYLAAVRETCRRHGVLFVADEVITGYGRTGAMFASHRWSLDPDVILTAKGLTSGYIPMGAVIASGAVAAPFRASGQPWRHGYTYSGHATAAAVAMANLDILEREGLFDAVASMELTLSAAVLPLRTHSMVADVRTVGLLAAVQLDPAVLAGEPATGTRVVMALRDRGVLTRLLVDGSLQISPAFVVTRDDLRTLATAIDETLVALGSTRASGAGVGAPLLPELTGDEQGGFGSNAASLRANVPPHHG